MSEADYSEALTGDRPEVGLPPPPRIDFGDEPEVDAAPPGVECLEAPTRCQLDCAAVCSRGRWRCPGDAAPDVCGGGDTDCDGQIDEDAPLPPRTVERPAVCCDGRGDPPCNGAPVGTWVDAGWVFVPHEGGVMVMAGELSVGGWEGVAAMRSVPPRACSRRLDGAHGEAERPMECVDLYGAAAFANAWSCARSRPPCYRGTSDGVGEERPLRPDDVSARVGAISEVAGCTGATLPSGALFAALAARTSATTGDCGARWCGECASDTVGAASLAADGDGLVGVLGNVWEWVWPGEGVSGPEVRVQPGGYSVSICAASAPIAAGEGMPDDYNLLGLRLVCPAEIGTSNACTGLGRGEGLCR